jgi:hypothetical protein
MTTPAKTGTERRREVLNEVADAVCRDRQNTYGDAEDNFANIALLWNVWGRMRGLGEFTAQDVAMMSALIKVGRAGTNIGYRDNWVDLAGYATCGGGIAAQVAEATLPPPAQADKAPALPTGFYESIRDKVLG